MLAACVPERDSFWDGFADVNAVFHPNEQCNSFGYTNCHGNTLANTRADEYINRDTAHRHACVHRPGHTHGNAGPDEYVHGDTPAD